MYTKQNTKKHRKDRSRAYFFKSFWNYIRLSKKTRLSDVRKVDSVWEVYNERLKVQTLLVSYENIAVDVRNNVRGLRDDEKYHLEWFINSRIREVQDDLWDLVERDLSIQG